MADVIRRVLVANRGEIARRVFRTCRAMGIDTVAVYADADDRSPHVSDADLAVPLGGDTAAESYLDIDKVIAAADRSGADAIHPGYGFLAENPALARACADAGVAWIGPPPDVMQMMASKIAAKRLAARAGIPLVPGATLDGDDPSGWEDACRSVGYPLLVKASAGGGGKGMRRVDDAAGLAGAVRAGRREATSSFGDPTVFVERLLEEPRHVEVQVLADRHGNVVHLLDRDCSLQRRHQKVVEEAPAPALPAPLRQRLHDAAVALARDIGYQNAGTIEFLVANGEFYFLEMNTRLQVEHAVTEEVTGFDLVRLQIDIAAGHPLPFGQDDVRADGHAVEVRLYAEDPRRDFLPSFGNVTAFGPVEIPGLRWEVGVEPGSSISPHYDPMLAKVIAHAGTRQQAALRLAYALRRLDLGGVVTNRDALAATLESPPFLDARVSTHFFDDHSALLAVSPPEESVRVAAVAVALVVRHRSRPRGTLESVAPPGWRNAAAADQVWTFSSSLDRPITVRLPPGRGVLGSVVVEDSHLACGVVDIDDDGADLVVDGLRHRVAVSSDASVHRAAVGGWQVALEAKPRFPFSRADAGVSGPSSPLPGTVVAVEVEPGQTVAAGDTLVVLEAMKMEHRIVAEAAGRVTAVLVACGDRVDAHQALVTLG